jgi:hypothetical protein
VPSIWPPSARPPELPRSSPARMQRRQRAPRPVRWPGRPISAPRRDEGTFGA